MEIQNVRFFRVEDPTIYQQLGKTRACRYCGQYPEKGDSIGIVVTQLSGTTLAKIIGNFFIHETCWHELIEDCHTFEEVLHKIARRPQPDTKNKIVPDKKRTERVKKALSNLSFVVEKETRNRIYFRKIGTRRKVAPLYYDKRFDKFEFTGRANGLFDRMILQAVFEQIQSEANRLEEE